MSRKLSILPILLIMAFAIWQSYRTPSATAAAWESKVAPTVLTQSQHGQTEFLVYLTAQADLSPAASLATKTEKGFFVYEQLTNIAQQTQPAVLNALVQLGAPAQAYWVANMIWVRGDAAVVEAMASRPDVAYLYPNPSIYAAPESTDYTATVPAGIEWNINQVNAPDVWADGVTGEGAVVAGQDTGYDWDHPAIKNQYRGWNGSSANHNYNWHDAIHSNNPNTPPGNVCGFDSLEPCDDNNHGTHTMGTMVGDDGGNNQIGMAPGADWISCRNMEDGWGTPTTYSECFQWFIAPTDLNNQNPDPSKAPHVVNNSWGCPTTEGCTDPNILKTVVENVRAAGIVVVVSAGNEGSSCSSVNTPAAIYDASFSVGATTSSDAIASFSSRGPVTVDGSNRLKPDISAPGNNVRSSIRNGGYANFSGTSMAGPHVAGLVALLISADPSLAGQVDEIEAIIRDSALQLTSTQTCGGVPGNQIPNNTFGYGRIDALAAYQSITPDPVLFRFDLTYMWTAGGGGQRQIDFYGDGQFTDNNNDSGNWLYQPTNNRIILSYPAGQSCQALLLGLFTSPTTAQGIIFCRDGSGLSGVWQATAN